MECKPLGYSLEGLGEGLDRVMAYLSREGMLSKWIIGCITSTDTAKQLSKNDFFSLLGDTLEH